MDAIGAAVATLAKAHERAERQRRRLAEVETEIRQLKLVLEEGTEILAEADAAYGHALAEVRALLTAKEGA